MKTTKTKKIEQMAANQIMASAKCLKLDTVVDELGKFQIGVQTTLADLSASLTNNIKRLSDVETAITLSEQRLKELYEIEKEATKLEEIKAQIETEQKRFSDLMSEQNKLSAEQASERNKKWIREEEEHKYHMDMLRKKALDEHNNLLEKNKREENIRKTELDKSWTERELKLQSSEQELANLKAQVATMPNSIKQKVDETVAIIKATLAKEHQNEMVMAKKEAESLKTLFDAKVSAMSEAMSKLEDQVTTLNSQLMESRKDAKDIAAQALQSASGKQVAEALQKVVDSKNDNNSKK